MTIAALTRVFVISAVLFFSRNVTAQQIDWLTIHEDQSRMTGISQLNNGSNYLIGGQSGGNQYFKYCDDHGVEIYRKELGHFIGAVQGSYRILQTMYTSTLFNGHHYHFMNNGHIVESDINYDTIGVIQLLPTGSEIAKIEQFDENILITATDTSTYQIYMNPLTLNVINHHRHISGAFYESGGDIGDDMSLLAFYFDNDTLTLIHRDTLDVTLFEKIISLANSSVSDVLIGDDNKYYVVGDKRREDFGYTRIYDGFLLALSSAGEVIWRRDFLADSLYGYNNFNSVSHVAQLSDESLIVVAQKGPALYGPPAMLVIAKVQTNGLLSWELEQNSHTEGINVHKLYTTTQDQIIIAGTTGVTDYSGPQRAYILQASELVGTISKKKEEKHFKIFPNPTTDFFQIESINNDIVSKLKIFDIHGKEMLLITEIDNNQVDVSDLIPGVYYLQLEIDHLKGHELIPFIKL